LETKLGFDRVRRNIADKCSTAFASQRVASEEFCTDPSEIRRRLMLTDEMRLILMFEESFPTSGYIDCLDFLHVLEQDGSNIDLLSLGKLRTLTETLRKILSFFRTVKNGVYPCLKKMTAEVAFFPEVQRRIDVILDKYGNVRDTASDELYSIRRSLKDKEGTVSKRMASLLKKAQQDGIVEADAGIAVRDGKMLLPVNTQHKRKVSGFVYDESSTGKTTYIEPAEIVELENEINELRFAENREIFRILSEFSDFVRPYVPELIRGAECAGEIDFIMAKAQTALDYIAGMPIISEDGEVNLRKARHPLLEKALAKENKKMVPITIRLTPSKRILLISGPNAGGKSVCLKTTGLLQYMFQWGMLIPTSETSEMMIFDRIMVDIGDGQSIDNDLSTYSSFLLSMKEMLSEADSKTLVLVDELGSGTEPEAGGAIAEAILAELDRRGVYGVMTTHYTNLKLYASTPDSGVINGAMAFDAKNILPLFQLEIGLPGNSFAFELARKTGLPEAIVKDAENRAGEEYVGIERNLRKIVRNRRALDEKLQKIKATDKTLDNITDKYQKELLDIKKKRDEILSEARREAEEIVKGANRQVENTIRTIKESQADKQKTNEARAQLQNFMQALSESKQQREDYIDGKIRVVEERNRRQAQRKERRGEAPPQEQPQPQQTEAPRSGPLMVGEKVRIKDNGMVGEVSKVSGKSVTVIVGALTSKLPLEKVERISSNEYKNTVKDLGIQRRPTEVRDPEIERRKLSFYPEIDVRGQRVDEALESVMKFVDDAIMLGVPSVRIIHGKGTGALRVELQKFLRTTPGVTSVKDEHIQQGGTGVTIVTF